MRHLILLLMLALPQATMAEPTPYFDHPITIPATVQMHWFDKGGQGVAYNDCTDRGEENKIRPDDKVDLAREGGDIYLGWLCPDEWLLYSLNVAHAASYQIDARVASAKSGGRFRLQFRNPSGKVVAETEVDVPATGGWTQWHNVRTSITLPKGPLQMRFEHLSGHDTYNVNRIRFCRFDPMDLDRDGNVSPQEQTRVQRLTQAPDRIAGAIQRLNLAPGDAKAFEATVRNWRPTNGQPLPSDAPWELIWSDEFNKPGLPDPSKWQYELGYKIRNNEAQHYTKDKNTFIEDGNLVIEARREKSRTADGREAEYTAASISPTTSWTYGRIEVRAKVPTGRGMWPAIWMLADRIDKVGWPQCGEIDIMENVGYDPQVIHGTVHTKKYNHVLGTQQSSSWTLARPWEEFHVYTIEWYPDRIDFYIDRIHYLTYANEGSGDAAWPFDNAHRLKLNIAVGGMWGGVAGINDDIFPQRMEIDYVRVYRAK